VLAVSFGASAVYAALDLLRGLVATPAPLARQTATLYAPRATQQYVDLAYQLADLAVAIAPVLLVAYLLTRSGESFGVIGMDDRRPRGDLAEGAGLAAVVGGAGLALLLAAKALGVNRHLAVVGVTRWWTVPVLLAAAASNALAEEAIVCAYLLHRLRQIGWDDGRALGASAALRGAYHLYQGLGGAVANALLGAFFGRIFQRQGRAAPLVFAHFLVDSVAFVGYVVLRHHAHWLP